MPTSASEPINSGGFFDYPVKKDRLEEVARLSEAPDFWNDAARAQELGRERKSLEDVVLVLDHVSSGLKDAAELFEMAREENDDDTLAAVQADIESIEKDVSTLEFRRMFNNPADPSNCFIDIQAGAGGTEACDWASMLLRQYGLDYALFFERAAEDPAEQRRTLHAVIVCSLSTFLVFALLALSTLPVLRAIGITVAAGVVSNFVLALLLTRPVPGPTTDGR